MQFVPEDQIQKLIRVVRDRTVILDADLATLYDVTTGHLNLAVRRNGTRFPADFVFQLTEEETNSLLSQFAIAKRGRGGRRTAPYAFTDLGVAMLSSVLNSERAIQMNIAIMRAFVRMRVLLDSNRELARHVEQIEAHLLALFKQHDQKLSTHEQAITGILKALRDLMNPPQTRAIGFTVDLSK